MISELHFAPLQGFTNHIFRKIHHKIYNNIDVYYSPFVRLETNNSFRNKDVKDILPINNSEINFIPQILAGEQEEAFVLINMLAGKGYKKIDINMGCPFPLITKKAKGAGILQYPAKVKAVLEILNNYKDIEFSLKMRSGMNNCNECFALIEMINNSCLKNVTLHPRIGKQQYNGLADRNLFMNFAEKCNKPLIYNGDIKNIEDMKTIETIIPHIKGVMIGRGLIENPALAMEYRNGKELNLTEKKELLLKFHSELYNEYSKNLHGEAQILSHLQPLWEYLLPEMDKKHRKKITKCTKLGNYEKSVLEALQ